jgi:hypothetical protein
MSRCLLAIVAAALAFDAVPFARQKGSAPIAAAIERIDVASDQLEVVHQDGTRFKPIREASRDSIQQFADFSQPAISPDRRLAGWLLEYGNCCTSYPIPLVLVIYQAGQEVRRIEDGLMMYEWYFWADGREAVYHADTVHGNFNPHAVRIDIATGNELARFDGNPDETSPSWTRRPQ